MYNDFQSPLGKKNEMWGIYISLKKFVFILVGLIFFFIFVFLVGVYMGKREALLHLTQQDKSTEETQENPPEPEPANTPEDNNTHLPPSTPEGSPGKTENALPVEKTSSEQAVVTDTPAPPKENTSEKPGEKGVQPPSGEETLAQQSTPKEQSTGQIELTPLTPPIEQEIQASPVKKEAPSPPETTPSVDIKQKPKTFSIQLSALTGDDAEKRARMIVSRLQKKYGNQYLFKIQPAGKFCKITVINIPDEKIAKEALRVLSQEPDFGKAFIVKPKK